MKDKYIQFVINICITFTALWLWLLIGRFIFNIPFIEKDCQTQNNQIQERLDEITQQNEYIMNALNDK